MSKSLHDFIKEDTPKFNPDVVDGLVYSRMEDGMNYLNDFIHYTCNARNEQKSNLRYLGYQLATPEEELKVNTRRQKPEHDVSKSTFYLVKFLFQYGDEEKVREYYTYIPYIEKGNRFMLGGKNFLVMPVLADKVISIGEHGIFINVLTAKYNFNKEYRVVYYKKNYKQVPIIVSQLYRNPSVKHARTTKVKKTVMHYLLSQYGYSKTMEIVLGYVPRPVYDTDDENVLETIGTVPRGWVGNKNLYEPTRIKFIIDPDKDEDHAVYCVGNVMYLIEEFSDRLTIEDLDKPGLWKRLLSEAIHSAHYSAVYLSEKIEAHFNDLNTEMNVNVMNKLKDVGVRSETLMDLLGQIFKNYNNWIMSGETRSYFYNKTYEVESFLLAYIANEFSKVALNIGKEELRSGGRLLDPITVDNIFMKHITMRRVFRVKGEKMFVTTSDCSGDHLYYKNSRMVANQESDAINIENNSNNTSDRHKISAASAVIGSILGLSKSNPVPNIHINPYVRIDKETGTVLPHPGIEEIMERTDRLLDNISLDESIVDISDSVVEQMDDDNDYDDDDNDD